MGKALGRIEHEGQTYVIEEDDKGVYTMVEGERLRVRSLGSKVKDVSEGGTVEVMHASRNEVLFWGKIEKAERAIE